MQQDLQLNRSTKRTRKREFLDELSRVAECSRLIQLIEPFYPRVKIARPSFPAETMLRIHIRRQWYELSDLAMEEAFVRLADVYSLF